MNVFRSVARAIISRAMKQTDYATLAITANQAANPSSGVPGDPTFMLQTVAALPNGAAAQTATMTNGPAAGNPTKWVPINDGGTTRYIPAW